MLKLFVGLPFLIFAMLACALGGVLVVPLVLGFGAAIFSIVLAVAVLALMLRIFAAIVLGIGGLIIGLLGFGFLAAGFALVLAFGLAVSHLLVPLLLIFALVWLIRRGSRPVPPAIAHS